MLRALVVAALGVADHTLRLLRLKCVMLVRYTPLVNVAMPGKMSISVIHLVSADTGAVVGAGAVGRVHQVLKVLKVWSTVSLGLVCQVSEVLMTLDLAATCLHCCDTIALL
jgi:hypothetical protein